MDASGKYLMRISIEYCKEKKIITIDDIQIENELTVHLISVFYLNGYSDVPQYGK